MQIEYSWVDFAIVAIVVFSTVISIMRGFVREAISLASWIIAVWISLEFGPLLAEALKDTIHSDQVRMLVSYLGLFLVMIIIGAIVSHFVSKLLKVTGLSGMDRILGMVFGLFRGALVIAIGILIASLTDLPSSDWWQHSSVIPVFKPVAIWLKDFFPDNLVFKL
jgi:membrane protein required for colicin V production